MLWQAFYESTAVSYPLFAGQDQLLKNAVLQYIPDHFFTTRMNARDFLMHMGAIQGMDADALYDKFRACRLAVIREYTHKFFMDDLLKNTDAVSFKSKRSLQKVAVIQALFLDP